MSERIFLNPGEWYFGGGDVRVETLLGSCISLTLWSPQSRLGGMCHFLLPSNPRPKVQALLDGRYGQDALAWLQQQTLQAGIDVRHCEVKLFGGSRTPQAGSGGSFAIGERNIQFAEMALGELGLMPRSVDVGGDVHRYLRFELATGDVWVRYGDPLPLPSTKERSSCN
jgi:chemotaxis protein CheD